MGEKHSKHKKQSQSSQIQSQPEEPKVYISKIYDKPTYLFKVVESVSSNSNQVDEQLKMKVELIVKIQNANQEKYSLTVLESKNNDFVPFRKEEMTSTTGEVVYEGKLIMDYFFEKEQPLIIQINNQGKLFEVKTTMGTIVGSRNGLYKKKIDPNREEELIIISTEIRKQVEIVQEEGCNIDFIFEADFVNVKNDIPYFEVSNMTDLLYRSECIKEGEQFTQFSIPDSLLQGDISITFFNNTKTPITKYTNTLNNFLHSQECKSLPFPLGNGTVTLYNKSRVGKKKRKKFVPTQSFVDYLHCGIEFNLTIGIDFTGSNGNSKYSHSLHYIENGLNDYENAIISCGNILKYYDSDQMYPVYGFGAEIPNKTGTQFCFPLNFNDMDPEIHTIEEISATYRKNISQIRFSGPTNFAPIVQKCLDKINEENDITKYHILLMLTDGGIDDMNATIKTLIEGSFKPLSVIIVGIGGYNFSNMDVLDADEEPLSADGKEAARDLVQFVPFREYKNDPTKLAEEVLKEIPMQVVQFYEMNGLTPQKINEKVSGVAQQ